jgi:hypothetical protein
VSTLATNQTLTTNGPDGSTCSDVCTLYDNVLNYTKNGLPFFDRPALVNGIPKRLEGNRVRCIDQQCFMYAQPH